MRRNWIILSLIALAFLGSVFWVYGKWQDRLARIERNQQIATQKFEEISVTFIEGKTNEQFYEALENKNLQTKTYYVKAEQDFDRSSYDILKSIPVNQTLLGFLFPDTYRFAKIGGEKDVLPTLVTAFAKKFSLASQDVNQSEGRYFPKGYENLNLSQGKKGLSVYELVTLAAIVEKETGQSGESINSKRLAEERQYVSGIFYNRLLAGQPLESDATVNFVTGASRAQPTYKDLEANSAYNTYKFPGLPPGPIANVSYSSLFAVLHPIKNDYYYFLHKQPSGEVVYSKTFQEHLQNKAKYLK